jgi:hypothetical protein
MNPFAPDSEPHEKEAADGSIVKPTYPRHAARAILPANLKLSSIVTNKYFPTQKEAEHCTAILILAHVGGFNSPLTPSRFCNFPAPCNLYLVI